MNALKMNWRQFFIYKTTYLSDPFTMIHHLHELKLLNFFFGESWFDEIDVAIGLGHSGSGGVHGEIVLVFDPNDKSLGTDESDMGDDILPSFEEVVSSITSDDSDFEFFPVGVTPDE